MTYYTKQDEKNRVINKVDRANKGHWNTSVHATTDMTIDQTGTVASPYYGDGRQVPAAKTYTRS